ncbi:MAG: hypothetical protein FWG46_00525 [Treponema sp.]|nr:hypothetical protein [Treponema sp.]
MKKALLTAAVLMFFWAKPAGAQCPQPDPPFRIGAALGCSFTGYKEEIESPINRYLNTLTYIIDGNIEKGNILHSLNINFFIGNAQMASPYLGYNHLQYISARGLIEYALDGRLWGNSTFPGFLGGAFRIMFYYTGVDFAGVIEKEYYPLPTGIGLFSLDLHASQKWIISEKHTLTFCAGYPLFGYAVRPAYAGFDELWMKYLYDGAFLKILSLGEIASFHNYWAFFGDLKYHYKISALLSSYSGLAFEISHFNSPRPRRDAIFRLNTGIAFTF